MMDSVGWKSQVMIAAAIALTACNAKAPTNQVVANAVDNGATSTANTAAPVVAAAAPATASGALTPEFMVGKWSAMNGDCSATIDFNKDGTVNTPMGKAKWTVKGDTLTFDYGDGSKPTVSTVKPTGPDKMEFTHDSGAKETEIRC